MNDVIKSFVAKRTSDPDELLAQRAIKCVQELRRLAQNFATRGKSALLAGAVEGIKAALYGFCCINANKQFFFANQVDNDAAAFTEFVKSHVRDLNEQSARLLAQDAIDFAEGIVATHRPCYQPVATVSGVSSVLILRGDHCLTALANLDVANNNN